MNKPMNNVLTAAYVKSRASSREDIKSGKYLLLDSF